jgi:hypothetical protein
MYVLCGPPTPDNATDEYNAAYQRWFSEPGTVVAEMLEKVGADLPERDEFSAYLTACAETLNDRHGVTHSIWVALGQDDWIGVRSVRPRKSEPDRPSFEGIRASEQRLEQRHDRLEQLRRATLVWRERIEASTRHMARSLGSGAWIHLEPARK